MADEMCCGKPLQCSSFPEQFRPLAKLSSLSSACRASESPDHQKDIFENILRKFLLCFLAPDHLALSICMSQITKAITILPK
jgi:hypothetical protein